MTDGFTLVIGNKAYSSWSLRAWLAIKACGVAFDEVVVPLRTVDTKTDLSAHSPSGLVPVLKHGDLQVWDSLAIGEYLAELFPAAGLWPEDRRARAVARAVAAEMHAGFAALRRHLPMDLKRSVSDRSTTPAVDTDMARIVALWRSARAGFGAGGPFLFGRYGLADIMFAPVCTRFATYGVEVDADARAYMDAVFALPDMRLWIEAAQAEPWVIDNP